ncbi:type VI secretion system baseplate subunit TssG [Endozoicomonadaceae bacterium StTr2]
MSYQSQTGLLQQLQARPRQWQFAQAIRVLVQAADHAPVSLTLHSDSAYQYTSAQLTRVALEDNHWTLHATLPALTGLNGVLPYGYQDRAHQLRVGSDDSALQDFYEIFNQRVLLNSYHCTTRYQLTCRFEQGVRLKRGNRPVSEQAGGMTLGEQLCSLAAIPAPRSMPADHLVQWVGLLGQKTSSTRVLQQILTDYFELPVEVSASSLRRYRIDDDCRTALSAWRSPANTLGSGALLGNSTWLANNRVELVITARDVAHKQQIQDDAQMLEQIEELCNLFLRRRVEVNIRLRCTVAMLPTPQLSGKPQGAARLGKHNLLTSGRDSERKVAMTLGRNGHSGNTNGKLTAQTELQTGR